MKISVRVKTNARKNDVKQLATGRYEVSVTAPPVDGKANANVIELFAEYFKKPKRCIAIIRGHTAKNKIIEVE